MCTAIVAVQCKQVLKCNRCSEAGPVYLQGVSSAFILSQFLHTKNGNVDCFVFVCLFSITSMKIIFYFESKVL